MIPTAILLAVAVFAALRTRRIASLRPAARALGALFVFDALHHAAEPIADIWRHGGALTPWQTWALRGDAWIVAGAWPGVVAWLSEVSRGRSDGNEASDRGCGRQDRGDRIGFVDLCGSPRKHDLSRFLWRRAPNLAYDLRSISAAAAFAAYGLVAVAIGRGAPTEMWTALLIAPRIAVGLIAGAAPKARSPSLLIGKIIAACQVAAAFFLWRHWSDVRLLASACWLACGWAVWRYSSNSKRNPV